MGKSGFVCALSFCFLAVAFFFFKLLIFSDSFFKSVANLVITAGITPPMQPAPSVLLLQKRVPFPGKSCRPVSWKPVVHSQQMPAARHGLPNGGAACTGRAASPGPLHRGTIKGLG